MPASTLIGAADLRSALRLAPPPIVIDVRWELGAPSSWPAYLDGHLPRAVWADLETDFSDPPSSQGRHPLPDLERLESTLRSWGIDDDSHVVVYDAANASAAARAWWTLRWAGLANVSVLDGGLAAWVAAGGSLERGAPRRPTRGGEVRVRPGAMPTVDAAGAARTARTGTLLDARATARYLGVLEPIDPVAGHIPGAVSAPTTDNVDADGHLRSPEALAERFQRLGVTAPVAAYCGSGVTAAHTVLALEVAGIDAALYPGSWSEWVTSPERPVARGPG